MNENDDPLPPQKERKSYLHAECKPEEKGKYIQEARRRGMKLTAWILDTLNSSVYKRKVIGQRKGVDDLGFIMELELDCGHSVEFSRNKDMNLQIPEEYLCDKCSQYHKNKT